MIMASSDPRVYAMMDPRVVPQPIQSQRVSEDFPLFGSLSLPETQAEQEQPPVFRTETSALDAFRLLFLLAGVVLGAYFGQGGKFR
jgi:hypothetical protein